VYVTVRRSRAAVLTGGITKYSNRRIDEARESREQAVSRCRLCEAIDDRRMNGVDVIEMMFAGVQNDRRPTVDVIDRKAKMPIEWKV